MGTGAQSSPNLNGPIRDNVMAEERCIRFFLSGKVKEFSELENKLPLPVGTVAEIDGDLDPTVMLNEDGTIDFKFPKGSTGDVGPAGASGTVGATWTEVVAEVEIALLLIPQIVEVLKSRIFSLFTAFGSIFFLKNQKVLNQ